MRYVVVACLLLLLAGCGSGGGGTTQTSATSSSLRARTETLITVDLRAGWNSVSFEGFPVTTLEAGPEIAGFAAWNGREYEVHPFTAAELMRLGQPRGLWVFAAAATSFRYAAAPYAAGVDLHTGWNLASFGIQEPIATADLRATDDGQPMPLGEAVLSQFQQINPDHTYTPIDVASGATLQPGRAYWIYAASDVSLEWELPTAEPSPSPSSGGIPFPSPGLTFPSPSPLAFPSPALPGPSPVTFPSPSPSPASSPALTSTAYSLNLGTVASISDDGRTVAALQTNGNTTVLQHADLVSLNLTVDATANLPGSRGPAALASSADGSLDALLIDGLAEDFLALHTRASNSSALVSNGLPLYLYSEGLDVSADGTVAAWTESADGGNQTVVFRTAAGGVTDVKTLFPGSSQLRTRGRGALSDDGRQLLFAVGDTGRHVQLDLTTGANVAVFEENSGVKQVSLSGNGRFALYHQGGAPRLTPVRALVRDLTTGADEELAAGTGSTFGTAISSDGRFVLFNTEAGLVPEDTNASFDYFLRDRLTRTTIRISVDERGAEFGGPTSHAVMSRNGRWIVFRDPSGALRRVESRSSQ